MVEEPSFTPNLNQHSLLLAQNRDSFAALAGKKQTFTLAQQEYLQERESELTFKPKIN